jgi:transposase-like protein
MSVTEDIKPKKDHSAEGQKKRRFLSPEKKFQIFLESQTGKTPVGEILRREGIYSTDLARIRKQVKEAALDRLSVRPGPKRKTVPQESYEALKRELEEKERALAEQAVELVILRKKTNGGSWER